jgi:arylsulfatase A
MKKIFLSFLLALMPLTSLAEDKRENIVMLYYDDMGYGDMGINFASPEGKKSLTPNLDKFATESLRFTHGHSADAVCTPSRYAIMTGRYAWRSRLKSGVIFGYGAPIISEDRYTIGKMFQELGYTTAMIGKWHIGMTFCGPDGKPIRGKINLKNGNIDFSQKLTDTPADRGFDYFFGTSASLDMPPYLWIENHTCLTKGAIVTEDGSVDFSQAQTAKNENLKEGGTPYGRGGIYDPHFSGKDYLQVQAAKIDLYFKDRAKDKKPFFLYVPMPAPHMPWALQDQFKDSAGFQYGDYMIQTDHYTGEILKSLEARGLKSNTVFFITSDNGPEKKAFFQALENGYDGNGSFRGVKRDGWEGGTRVPFMIRWPGKTKPGVTNHACWQGDFMATIAEHLGKDLAEDQAEDAESFLPILLGKPMPEKRRPGFVEHSFNGQFSLVDSAGRWKLIDGTGGGGLNLSVDADNNQISNSPGKKGGTPRQLFDLEKDPGERHNLLLDPSTASLEKELELLEILNKIRKQ